MATAEVAPATATSPATTSTAITRGGFNPFKKASRLKKKLRLAIDGPPGAGKTLSALRIAMAIARHEAAKTNSVPRVAVIDTENGSASVYEGDLWDDAPLAFDTLELSEFAPSKYSELVTAAGRLGYHVVVIDSLSHAWAGSGGALDLVDQKASKSNTGNSFTAWKEVTPQQNEMIDTMIRSSLHVIATMRTKMEWVLQPNERGKMVPVKIGMAPIQRQGVEYEFDIVMDIDTENIAHVSKSRCSVISGKAITKPGANFAELLINWLERGNEIPQEILDAANMREWQGSGTSAYSEGGNGHGNGSGNGHGNGNGSGANGDKPLSGIEIAKQRAAAAKAKADAEAKATEVAAAAAPIAPANSPPQPQLQPQSTATEGPAASVTQPGTVTGGSENASSVITSPLAESTAGKPVNQGAEPTPAPATTPVTTSPAANTQPAKVTPEPAAAPSPAPVATSPAVAKPAPGAMEFPIGKDMISMIQHGFRVAGCNDHVISESLKSRGVANIADLSESMALDLFQKLSARLKGKGIEDLRAHYLASIQPPK